ncbi:MAG TPA: hypothetical protein VHF92_13435 [Geodermatophilus sp.]|nr:hypothetical protein [Geodermatophilus sp.]
MTNDEPVEPSAIYARDGRRLPYARATAAATPAVSRRLLPGLARVASAGPLLTASAVAVAAMAATKVAEVAGRMALQVARDALEAGSGRASSGPGVEISFTHVEIRWPL